MAKRIRILDPAAQLFGGGMMDRGERQEKESRDSVTGNVMLDTGKGLSSEGGREELLSR